MIAFNDLRITDDGASIIVSCAVEDYPEFEDIYIKTIHLDYYKNSSILGVPSSKALEIYNNTESDPTTVKAKRIKVPFNQLIAQQMGITAFENGMFYVIVTCDGEFTAEMSMSPCGSDSMVTVGIILDWEKVYDRGMAVVNKMTARGNEFCGDTSIVSDIMVWHGLMASLAAKDYKQLERIWDMFLRIRMYPSVAVARSGCGCK